MEESLLNYNFVLYKPYRNVLMGLAITWVILHHFSLYSPSLANIFIPFAKGSSGVEIFFFLSVYGLCFSYEKYGLKTFYLRRIQRIFPMYFVFIAIWYIGCILSGITIDNPVRIIINTVTCLSCISTLHTGHDIVEWYIPAQVFIYLTFPVLYKFVKKSSLLNTCKLTLIYFSFVTLGVVASLFASRPLYLRLPVIFLGVLTYFNGGGKFRALIFLSALITFFIPNTYALSTSLIMPLMLYAYNYVYSRIYKLRIIDKIFSVFGFLGKHSLEIYLAQAFTTQYYLKNAISENILAAWSSTILLTIVIALTLYYIQKYFYVLFKIK